VTHTPFRNFQLVIPVLTFCRGRYNLKSKNVLSGNSTDVPDVFASFYWRRDKALIYAVNLGAQKCAAHLKVDLMKIGWSAQKRIAYRSLGAKGGARVGDIAVRGIKVSLPALQNCLLEIA